MSDKDKSQTAFRLFLGNDEHAAKITAERPELLNAQWVPAAKAGQVVDIKAKLHTVTAESLESSLGTWKGRKIYKNHETEIKDHKILDEKFEDPFLSFLLDTEIVAALDKGGGGSIDAIATLVEEGRIRTMSGIGYSVLDKDKTPACTKEAGCGIAGEGAADKNGDNVNLKRSIVDPNIKLEEDKADGEVISPQDLNKNKEEMEKEMADKEEKEVTFSEDQVAVVKAEAVKELTDHMNDSHKVAITDLEKLHATEIKTLKEAHIADLETQRVEVTKHIETVESLATKFALSDEAKKTMAAAKTPEEIYAFLETLKVTKAEPVIAAEGAAEGSGCGVILGSEVEGKAPETIQVEEMGTWDPYTQKYIPSFRTELK